MDQQNTGKEKGRLFKIGTGWLYLILILALLLPSILDYSSTNQITWKDFEQKMLSRHAVDKVVVVNNEIAKVYIKPEFANDPAFKDVMKNPMGKGINPGPHFQFTIGSIESFERKLDEAQEHFSENDKINISYAKSSNWTTTLLPWLIPIFLMVIFFRFFLNGSTGGSSVLNFGRSTAQLLDKSDKSSVTFEDVAGLEEAKQEVKEIVDFLKNPVRYTKLGAKIPKGVIIVGPTGTGKTLLAKAVAGEAQVPFFSLSGSEFVEMFVGVGASRVRDLFKRAKEKAPSIIFIDEIDAVGRSRGKNTFYTGANDERESTLNQLLTEMDGFGTNSGVIVLAATNRGDMLDHALLRPGRFDRHIYLDLPNYNERKAIFRVHLKVLILAESVSADFLASQTPGFSGADIANICNEAALIAARNRKDKVERQDFMDALDRIVAGLEKKSKILSAKEKKTIAYHEAGHAVASWFLKNADPLVKVSIIPRGKSLGSAWYLPEERQLKTLTELEEHIFVALAGRAAEELTFGEISSGALDDLERVTKDAYAMAMYYGFNKKIGNVSFYDSGGREAFQKPYSEETAKLIDEEVRKFVETSYINTKNLLVHHQHELTKIAELLLQREVIFKEDLEKILGERIEEISETNTMEVANNNM
ncbi:MAG: ATP-dependent metallopeptidase FtsH/Yme1/Tma family protein [Bacteroidetes bacterium]|nr:ATP-dependent metallopeptidase FtsH/Yme1/Tma family protein [Bacteroidota bacterium]